MANVCFKDPSSNLFQGSSSVAALTKSHNHSDLPRAASSEEEPKQMLLFTA